MKNFKETLKLVSEGMRPTFHNITKNIKEVLGRSQVQNGICTIYSHHTTCSVMMQECSFDISYSGLEYMQQDLIDIFEKIIPTCRKEHQYMHPGPLATTFAAEHGESKQQALNTDAHLRSVLIGRSETIPIIDGKLDLGSFGNVYFIDFDQTCIREREAQIVIIGE